MNINKVFIAGNLTKDPESKITASGKRICNFGVAVNETWGENKKVHFFNCVAFGRTAETIANYMVKGRSIFVEGSLDYSTWENDEGQKRSAIKIKVFNFSFVGYKEEKKQISEKEADEIVDELDIPETEIPF